MHYRRPAFMALDPAAMDRQHREYQIELWLYQKMPGQVRFDLESYYGVSAVADGIRITSDLMRDHETDGYLVSYKVYSLTNKDYCYEIRKHIRACVDHQEIEGILALMTERLREKLRWAYDRDLNPFKTDAELAKEAKASKMQQAFVLYERLRFINSYDLTSSEALRVNKILNKRISELIEDIVPPRRIERLFKQQRKLTA